MDIAIPCDVYVRLASIVHAPNEYADGDLFTQFIRIENGIAIASNSKIAVFELSTNTPGVVNVLVDPGLLAQCEIERGFASWIYFSYIPELQYVTAKTTLGYQAQTNLLATAVKDNNPIVNWRAWFPKELPKKSKGAMYFEPDKLSILAAASPSGCTVAQEFIVNDQPCIIRDIHDEKWIGVFMPQRKDKDGKISNPPAANIPTWLK